MGSEMCIRDSSNTTIEFDLPVSLDLPASSIDENSPDDTIVGTVTIDGVSNTDNIDAILINNSSHPPLTYLASTGKFYRAVEGDFSWANANTNAVAAQLNGVAGQLVTIRSETENDHVHGLASSIANDVWIGASDQTTEGDWHWYENGVQDNGELFWVGNSSGSSQNSFYTNWKSGVAEPTAGGADEDFARLTQDTGEWRDTGGPPTTNSYVIEWDAAEILGTFTLTDNANGRFAIDTITGDISVADGSQLDFEADMTHDVTVAVDYSGNVTSEVFTITVNNVNEAPVITGATMQVTPFINEIHYDNDGIDTGEAIEIAAPAGTDLTGWSLVRYNGANGQTYGTGTDTLSGVVSDPGDGIGTLVINYPTDGLQNGDADGVALVDDLGNVVQFLSYEGTLTAVNGPAAGLTSTDIGATESGNTIVGTSLQLTDSGWQTGIANTFGGENTGQSFASLAIIDEDSSLTFSAAVGNPITIDDVDANGAELAITLQVTNGTITLGGTSGLNGLTGDGTAAIMFTATIAEINAALEGLTYTANPDFTGNDLLTINVDDQGNTGSGGALTTAASVDITVIAVNDAPALDTTANLIVPTVDEDDFNPAGDTVANIVASGGLDNITDVDTGAVEGIAVYTVDDTNGTWEYSLDGGGAWTGIGAVDTATALLLDPTAMIRFVPEPDLSLIHI